MSARVTKPKINLRELLSHFKNILFKPSQVKNNQLLRVAEEGNLKAAPEVYIDDNGNIGIGTSTPAEALHISKDGVVRAYVESGDNGPVQMRLKSSNENRRIAAVDSNISTKSQILLNDAEFKFAGETSTNDLYATLNATGLGIGTDNPVAHLHISDGNPWSSSLVENGKDIQVSKQESSGKIGTSVASNLESGHSAKFFGARARGTLDVPLAVQDFDKLCVIEGYAFDGISLEKTSDIKMTIDGPVSIGVVPTNISFSTSETNQAAKQERMTIKSDGKVGIGSVEPASLLHIAGSDGNSKVVIEDASLSAASRELLHLKNNGGSYITMDNTATEEQWFLSHENNQQHDFLIGHTDTDGSILALRLTSQGTLSVPEYIGVGTENPATQLHINEVIADTSVRVTLSNSNVNAAWELVNQAASDHKFAINYTGNEGAEFIFSTEGDLDMHGRLTTSAIKSSTAMTVPSTSSDPGEQGSMVWDSDYIYICTAANTWKRSALATW